MGIKMLTNRLVFFALFFTLIFVLNISGQNIQPPAAPDTSWWINAPKDTNDVQVKIWIGKAVTNSTAAKGSRENPFTGMAALGDAMLYARTLVNANVKAAILFDVPNSNDKIGVASWDSDVSDNDPYHGAGVVSDGENWFLIQKIGPGEAYVYAVADMNPLDMGLVLVSTFGSSTKIVIDGLIIANKWNGDGVDECQRRAIVRIPGQTEVIFRNCRIYRNTVSDCNLHTGGIGIKITNSSKVLFENNIIAANASWGGGGNAGSFVDIFGKNTSDITFRNNYFHGSDYDQTGNWDKVSRIYKDDGRGTRIRFSGNVFSFARRVYDSRAAGNDALFYIRCSDVDIANNIFVQLAEPLGAQNFSTIFYFNDGHPDSAIGRVRRVAIRNNLFVNPNGSLGWVGRGYENGYVHDLGFFNNVMVNSVKSTDWANFDKSTTEWFPGFGFNTKEMTREAGPLAHDHNVYYGWETMAVNSTIPAISSAGYQAVFNKSLLFDSEPNSQYNTLDPGLNNVGEELMPFEKSFFNPNPAASGPISFSEWVDYFRPINENLKDKGTAAFYGTNYASGLYNRDIDGHLMVSANGKGPAGPFGFGDKTTLIKFTRKTPPLTPIIRVHWNGRNIQIKSGQLNPRVTLIRLLNVKGRVLQILNPKKALLKHAGFNTRNLASGLYIVEAQTVSTRERHKVVLTR